MVEISQVYYVFLCFYQQGDGLNISKLIFKNHPDFWTLIAVLTNGEHARHEQSFTIQRDTLKSKVNFTKVTLDYDSSSY